MKELSLRELLDTDFIADDKGDMIGIFTLERINMISDIITNLQQENEELKKNQRYYKNGVFSLEYDKETMSDMIDDYKSRIEKAIEYIEQFCDRNEEVIDAFNFDYSYNHIIDILNGRSDE